MQTTQGERETAWGRAGETGEVVVGEGHSAHITGSESQEMSPSPLPAELKAWIDNVILPILKLEMMN